MNIQIIEYAIVPFDEWKTIIDLIRADRTLQP
jgi:hypothetical protein